MTEGSSAAKKAAQVAGRKAAPVRKAKSEPDASAPPTSQAAQPKIGDPHVRAHLKKGITELQRLHELMLTNEVSADVLVDFRDALNRVRNTAWAAQQYVARKESDQDSTSVSSFLAGERIRVTYQLCQALSDDLNRTDIKVQRGSLVQLYEATKNLTEQLKTIIDKM
jgi:hypothetical protein